MIIFEGMIVIRVSGIGHIDSRSYLSSILVKSSAFVGPSLEGTSGIMRLEDDPIIKDAESGESSSEDVEVNTDDVPEDMHEDNHQYKAAKNNAGEKSQPDESDPVVIMARQLQLTEKRLSQQDQFNEILLGTMTKMEAIMTALTKTVPDVQALPTTNAPKKADLKDVGTSGVCKDNDKGIAIEEPKKTPSMK
uniref:Uncharacterized protein n=1 Tax=Cannabis sativa TaxID=3483 RepID=A0A803PB53_CANSA